MDLIKSEDLKKMLQGSFTKDYLDIVTDEIEQNSFEYSKQEYSDMIKIIREKYKELNNLQ